MRWLNPLVHTKQSSLPLAQLLQWNQLLLEFLEILGLLAHLALLSDLEDPEQFRNLYRQQEKKLLFRRLYIHISLHYLH